jgi:VanZ family protein
MAGFDKTNLWQAAFVSLLAVVLFMAVAPQSATPVGAMHIPDKLEHIAAFAALGMVMHPAAPNFSFAMRLFFLGALALALEFIQAATPFGRVAEILDWIASAAGAIGGLAFATMVEARLQPSAR